MDTDSSAESAAVRTSTPTTTTSETAEASEALQSSNNSTTTTTAAATTKTIDIQQQAEGIRSSDETIDYNGSFIDTLALNTSRQLSDVSSISNSADPSSVDHEEADVVGDRMTSFHNQSSLNNSFSYGAYNGESDVTIFNQVSYLGCSTIESPKSEAEIQKIMSVLNAEKIAAAIEAAVLIPATSDGIVELVETATSSVIAQFRVHRILFCARGRLDTNERDCFAFSYLSGCAPDATVYQCHAFRCNVPEAVGKVLLCFASAFSRTPKRHCDSALGDNVMPEQSGDGAAAGDGDPGAAGSGKEIDFQFDIFLEIKEDDGKGSLTLAPQEKNCFKLRRARERRVIVALQQVAGPKILVVQKCFGLLLAAGRNVKHSDMHLLDMQSMGRGNDDRTYLIEALWDPNSPQFEVLNMETPKDTRVFITVAADVVLSGIHEPVRFLVECKARIFHEHERFWYVTRKPVVERYFLTVTRKRAGEGGEVGAVESYRRCAEFEVALNESATERERRMCRTIGRSPSKMPANLVAPPDEDESDSDEPLLSGSGEVIQECSEETLSDWGDCLNKWHKDLTQRPKEVNALIRNGVPDALRGEVWQLLVNCYKDPDMMDTYRLLLGKACPNEQVILRDIHRTFPAHDYFKEAGGVGQDALYKLSKAYSLYDEEVGYCQGLSFLAASLLLHMPEEQAFCVLVKIMFDYGMRDFFKQGFEALHLRFYQLERLMEDYAPDLWQHFTEINVEAHMFASQWFLTMFTAKFPLLMVFHIIDLFLSEGINTIFHISLALLKASKKDLLQLDFEGALKYFRVVLPRKYRTEATSKELIQQAVRLKISHKRLSKYEKEYITMKQQEAESQDPLERLERENLKLKEAVMRLERENDDLAHELVTSKVQLRNRLDAAEDNIESLQAQVEKLTRHNNDAEEENKQLLVESEQVKEMCRRELQKLEEETKRSQTIITNYKQICSDLSNRLEKQQSTYKQEKKQILKIMNECDRCGHELASTDGGGGNGLLMVNGACGGGSSEDCSPRDDEDSGDAVVTVEGQEEQIRQLELELAQTKLALVESQCRNQDLTHQLNNVITATQDSLKSNSGTWLSKTITTIKEAARNPSLSKENSANSLPPFNRKDSTSSYIGSG